MPPATLRTIVETAGGNPLFLEQMLAMIQDAPGGDVAVPPTIHALLSARLDRLDGGQRDVVGTASVVGQVFPEAAVVELVPDARRPAVPEDLGGLVRRRLVQSHPAVMTAGAAYTFQHILIRDAAYAGLLKRHRAELHERFVAWADEVNGDRAGEYEEILGYHLEQAHAYLAELGPLDDRGRAIGRQASERLRSAGHRAFARGDMPAAANLLRRAAALLPAFDQDRLDLLPDLGEALMDVGEFAEAREVLRQAIAAGNEAGDHRLRADASLVLVLVEFYAEAPPDWSQRAARVANAAIPIFELLGDDAGLAKAWRVLGAVHATALRYGAAAQAVARATDHARAAGDLRQERRNASSFAVAAVYGPTPVEAAIEECSRIAADATGDRRTEGLVLGALAHLEAMRGEFDRARDLSAQARSTLEELGNSVLAAATSLESGAVELLAGNPAEAERLIRRDVAELERMGVSVPPQHDDRPACPGGGRAGPRRRGRRAGRGRPAADRRRRRRVGRPARVRTLGAPRPGRRRRRRSRRGPPRGRAPRECRRAGHPRRGAPGAGGGLRRCRGHGRGDRRARPGGGRVQGEGLRGRRAAGPAARGVRPRIGGRDRDVTATRRTAAERRARGDAVAEIQAQRRSVGSDPASAAVTGT